MDKALYEPFNDQNYALRLQEGTYNLEYRNEWNLREPSVQAILKIGAIEDELGYQLYDTSFPALLPSDNTSEYVRCFGHDNNFNIAITLSSRQTKALKQTTPCRTMVQGLTTWQNFVLSHTTRLLEEHGNRFNVDLSTSALFNRYTEIALPDDQMYDQAYKNDEECQWL
eukprot:10846776-Ditylum_brightwellii.AAC.1